MSLVAQQLKLDGMLLAAAKHKESLKAAQWLAQLIGQKQETVSINDVRQFFGPDALANASGSVFVGGDWEHVGYTRASHDAGRARDIKTWRLRRGNRS